MGEKVPALFYFLGIKPAGQDASKAPTNHSPKFYIDESGLELGVRSMIGLTVDYMQRPK